MFSNLTIALVFGLGGGGWVYLRTMRSSGNNTRNSFIAGGVTAVLVVIILTIILDLVFKTHK